MGTVRGLAWLLSSTVALGALSPAFAQDAQPTTTRVGAVDDTEIVVTAQKREERLLNVPVPVTALNAEILSTSNQVLLRDYYSRIPSLNLTPGTQGAQVVSIRGITTGRGNPTVGVTIDDVPFGSSFGLGGGQVVPDIDPGDLARVEVLRGPQGSLYGASSMGGLLKFVTVDPSVDAVSGRIQAGVVGVDESGELGYSLRGAINFPLGDTAAMRASGFYRRDPGYIDNLQTGEQDVNSAHAYGGRLSFMWRPSASVSVKLGALFQQIDGNGASEVHVGLADLQQRTLIGTGIYTRKVQAYDATIRAALGPAEIVSITGYNVNSAYEIADQSYLWGPLVRPIFGVSGGPLVNDNETKKFTQEVRVTAPLGDHLDFLAGAFFTDEDSVLQQTVLAQDATTGATAGRYLFFDVQTGYREFALFANLTLKLSDRFDIQIGGRQSWLHQRFEQTQINDRGVSTLTPKSITKPDAFTYLLTPRFRITPDIMIYARLASGYRAGGANAGGVDIPRSYEPDQTRNYELGFKASLLDRMLTVDASLFYIDWKDIQLNVRPATISYTTNASRAESKGIELSVDLRPWRGFTLSAWGVYNEAELSEDFPAAAARVAFGLEGDRLPWSARWSGAITAQQEFPLSDIWTASLGGSVNYMGNRIGIFRTQASPLREVFPSYTRVDLSAGLKSDVWRVNAYVNNVGNSRGRLWGGIGAIPPFGYYYIQPRTYGLSVTREF